MPFHISEHLLGDLIAAFAYGLVTIALIIVGFKLFDWLTPRIDIQRELTENKNVAVAIVTAAVILGVCYVTAHVVQ